MVLCAQIEGFLSKSSWIRRMFEAGMEMKALYGAEHVYDFSLGNPDLAPPPTVSKGLQVIAQDVLEPFSLGYMPNAGYLETRKALAAVLSQEQNIPIGAEHVVMTCGAAGGLNALFRAVLEPGDTVLCPAPYFVEYGFYASNVQAEFHPVPTRQPDFSLDVEALEQAITERTRCVLINSPNNPTGRIYSVQELTALTDMLRAASKRIGKPILLVADEPYRFLTYDKADVPALFPLYEHSIVVSSFSKNLALAGERVGFVAVNPAMPQAQKLIAGLILTNRILGFVNAPALGQKVLCSALGSVVDTRIYARRRDLMAGILKKAGLSFFLPQGAFYFFPRIPQGDDDTAFVQMLMEERILAVPGSGFGYPGHFRLTFCVPEETIIGSQESFIRAVTRALA